MLCVVATLGYLFFYHILLRGYSPAPRLCKTKGEKRLLVLAPLLLNGILLIVMFQNELTAYDSWLPRYGEAFIWHQIPLPLFIIIELALFAALTLWIYESQEALSVSGRACDFAFWIVAVFMATLVGYSMYCPNPFLNLYHVNAYYQPVLYVLKGIPYGEIHNSIYGHYGLFLAPLVRLLQAVGFGSAMRCFTLQQQLLVSFTLFSAVRNRFLRFIGLLASGFVLLVLRDTTYQQLYPHRTFPLILMAAALALNMRFDGEKSVGLYVQPAGLPRCSACSGTRRWACLQSSVGVAILAFRRCKHATKGG